MSLETAGWYASVFFWLYFTGLGVPPCPEEAGILYAASLNALHPEMRWWFVWPLTSAGIFCADATLYAVGRRWGGRLFEFRWVRAVLQPERRQRLEARLNDHGVKLLIAARLLPPLRTGVFLIAGAVRYPFARFLLADGAFAVLGVGVLFFCGTGLVDLVNRVGSRVLWVAVPAVLVYLSYRYFRYLQRREGRGEPAPPVSVLQLPAAGPGEPQPREHDGRSTPPHGIQATPPPNPLPETERGSKKTF
jgi:membrane protein DedA with SNARE-associated domain